MTQKIWQIKPKVPADVVEKFPEIQPLVLQLLYNRGLVTTEQIEEFLNPDYTEDLHDPFLFADALKAVKRILAAKTKKEKVVVYGDYDADGVSASAVIISLLDQLGISNDVYIPYRDIEGYGLNEEAVRGIATAGAKLVITVDCGITNNNEVDILQAQGVDVIITDHHQPPPNLPRALAILNPNVKTEKYPYQGLSGAGVAFKLVQAVLKYLKEQNDSLLPPKGWEKWLLDLVAIATISDMCPLVGENRTLVRWGTIVLQKSKRLGLQELVKLMGNDLKKLEVWSVAWQIGPRLNAAGRLNHASTAYRLLITKDLAEAKKLALELEETNRERQKLTDKMAEEAKAMLGEVDDSRRILLLVKDDWPLGLVGLIAGRLSDQYNRPSLVACKNHEGNYVGSGRSITGFNLIQAIQECSELLLHAGGHSQAAGFTVADKFKLEEFFAKLDSLTQKQIKPEQMRAVIEVEMEVGLDKIDWALWEEISSFAPFGYANPQPVLLARGLKIESFQTIGKDNKHLRLLVSHGSQKIHKTIGFSLAKQAAGFKVGDKVDLVFELGVNEWNGNRELQLKIVDFLASS
ncbi:MAG: single-stranded-DNA-specific exonuclease RecJ [Candidatus Buchananbacteria bacterium]